VSSLFDRMQAILRGHIPELRGDEARKPIPPPPGFDPASWPKLESVTLRLPPAPEAQYRYQLFESIVAFTPPTFGLGVAAWPHPAMEGVDYFWYIPQDYLYYKHRSEDTLVQAYTDIVLKLLTLPTRITQSRGLISWRFVCEALDNAGWSYIYGHLCRRAARAGFHPPPISERKTVYRSPPLHALT
jgi:hypothetical protein